MENCEAVQEQSVSPALTTQQDQYFTVKCLRHVWIIIFTIQTSYSIRARVAGTFWRERSSDGNFHLRWKASDNCSRFRDEAEQMHRKHDEGRQNENMSQRQVGEEERKKRGDQTQSVMPHNYSSSFHYSQSCCADRHVIKVAIIFHIRTEQTERLQPCALHISSSSSLSGGSVISSETCWCRSSSQKTFPPRDRKLCKETTSGVWFYCTVTQLLLKPVAEISEVNESSATLTQ